VKEGGYMHFITVKKFQIKSIYGKEGKNLLLLFQLCWR